MAAERKKRYACLIFDADHTLLDYVADEIAAFARVYEGLGMERSERLLADSRRHSEETWTQAGMYDVQSPRVQKTYHDVYRSHVEDIFKKVFAAYPCPNGSATAKEAGERFLTELEKEGVLLPLAEETLARLSQRYRVCIATNGLSGIQRGRLARFEKYAKAYISEEMGVIKPLPAFFAHILRDMGVSADECLMIGDSLVSDVAGAKAVGIDCCWLNPEKRKNTTGYIPDYEISALAELQNIL